MTLLTTWPASGPTVTLASTAEPGRIRAALAADGIRFERWPVLPLPTRRTPEDAALAVHSADIDALRRSEGYKHVDALAMIPSDDPAWAEQAATARAKFRSEHTHADDEDRFFARGAGVFYLHVGNRVHAVLCEAGDALSVPAGTRHWFDMGARPEYVAIRFFHDEGGWEAEFTGDPIAERFPDFDELHEVLEASRPWRRPGAA